jgi:hypothetical protein
VRVRNAKRDEWREYRSVLAIPTRKVSWLRLARFDPILQATSGWPCIQIMLNRFHKAYQAVSENRDDRKEIQELCPLQPVVERLRTTFMGRLIWVPNMPRRHVKPDGVQRS